MVQAMLTVADMVPESTYLYDEPFLIISHVVEDIGLVGWGNKRWTHQDKIRSQTGLSSSPAQASGWMQAFDPDSNKYYFYNTTLGITTWEEPEQDYQADETVEYYKKLGIAPTWERSTKRSPSKRSPLKTKPTRGLQLQEQTVTDGEHVREQQVPVAITTAACDQQQPGPESLAPNTDADGADLVPACVRFAPKKKGELPPNVERYWILRYSLFSRWGSGVYVDETSLFSVTPEVIAQHHARMLCGGASVLDAFCGCGGNTIALAQHFDKVIASDIDAQQLEMARRNCEAYGVGEKVSWRVGDFFKSSEEKVDTVFLSPPWGGPAGSKDSTFDAVHALPGVSWSVKDSIEMACSVLSDVSLQADSTSEEVPNIAVYLPRNTLMSSLRECLLVQGFTLKPLCLERNVLNRQLKAVTLYLRCTSNPNTGATHTTTTAEVDMHHVIGL